MIVFIGKPNLTKLSHRTPELSLESMSGVFVLWYSKDTN